MQREDKQNRAPARILSATTLHILLLVLGFVHYTLLGVEGAADYASERDGGIYAIGVCCLALLSLLGAYARRFQLVALCVLTLSTTVIWVMLSDEGRAVLSEPLTFAALTATLLGMWGLLLRLRSVRTEDARSAEMRSRRQSAVSAVSEKRSGNAKAHKHDSPSDAIPWIVGLATLTWLLLPALILVACLVSGVVLTVERRILGVMSGTTLAIIAVYVTALEPMLFVRDVPRSMPTRRLIGAVLLLALATGSAAAGWAVFAGGAHA